MLGLLTAVGLWFGFTWLKPNLTSLEQCHDVLSLNKFPQRGLGPVSALIFLLVVLKLRPRQAHRRNRFILREWLLILR